MSNINRPPLLHRIASYLFGWEWHYTQYVYQYEYIIDLENFQTKFIPIVKYCWSRKYRPKIGITNYFTISSYRCMPTLRRLRRKYRVKYIQLNH